MYTLRNENGMMICKLNEKIAMHIIKICKGFWQDIETNDVGLKRSFFIKEDYCLQLKEIKLYLWKGYAIIFDTE